MDCALTRERLLGYHLAALEDDEHGAVEAHILTCTACLRAYMAIKRHVEGGGRDVRPGDAVRARLRASVAAEFRPRASGHLRRLLARPIPLYQGLAAAAVGIVLAAMGPRVPFDARPEPHASVQHVDTSRQRPDGLTFY